MLGFLPGHVYFETAAVIITLIRLGKFLEARAKGRTSEPQEADEPARQEPPRHPGWCGDRKWPTDDVKVGDVVIVRPGEKFPVDGVVVDGRSATMSRC